MGSQATPVTEWPHCLGRQAHCHCHHHRAGGSCSSHWEGGDDDMMNCHYTHYTHSRHTLPTAYPLSTLAKERGMNVHECFSSKKSKFKFTKMKEEEERWRMELKDG